MIRPSAALAAVLVLAGSAFGRPPDVVRWQDAAAHVGRVITVEGTVARARVEGGACTLEFAPDDETALRVVLMLALFQAPDDPERLYAGRRVQASGRVQRFEGRPEIIIRRADQITVMDDASSTTTLPAPAAATTTTLPAPAAVTLPATAPSGPSPTCAQATERSRVARRELGARAEAAAGCLRAETASCRSERNALGVALAALTTREAEADAACR